jgi:hypothetical protein
MGTKERGVIMKIAFKLYTILIAVVIILVGCGGGGSSKSSEPAVAKGLKIVSKPITEAVAKEAYTYQIELRGNGDVNVSIPTWLWFDDELLTLSGVPQAVDVGISKVTINAFNDRNETNTQSFYIDVKQMYIELNKNLVFLPSYELGYKATKVPVEFILSKYDNIANYTILFTRSIDGIPIDYTFGRAMIDVTHNVAIISAEVDIPENDTNLTIDHTISAMYLKDGIEELIYAVNVKQSIFVPEVVVHQISVDMQNANGGYTLVTDENGVVTITPNESFMKDSCDATGGTWNQQAMICIPPEHSLEYQDVLDCVNRPNPPNQWSFDLHACYAELQPQRTTEEICGILGVDYNSTSGTCTLP